MAAHGLGEPAEADRDLYRQVVRSKSRKLANQQLDVLMSLFYDPSQDLTVRGIVRDVGVSKPTAMRYRNLLLAALESGPQTVLSSVHQTGGAIKKPSDKVLRQNQYTLGRENAKIREQIQKQRNRLTADDVSAILDRQIRRLDQEEQTKPTELKALIDQKIKLEDLNNPGQEEVIDPRKVLGKEGLAMMNDSYLSRLTTLAAHRGELSELWAGICSTIIFTIMDDVEQGADLPKGLNGETFRYIASFAEVVEEAPEQDEVDMARETSKGESGDGGSQAGNEKPEHDASYGASQDHAQQPATPVAPEIEL